MAGWGVFIASNTNRAIGEKLLLLYGTPNSPVVHRTEHCSMSGAPSHCPVRAGERWRRRLFTLDSTDFTPDSPVVFSARCNLELAVGLGFPGAPDSPVCGHRRVRCSSHRQSAGNTRLHSWTFFDLLNVFFRGVAFLNSLVQVILASCELQTETLENLLVHRLC
jgi:hypothetical protein